MASLVPPPLTVADRAALLDRDSAAHRAEQLWRQQSQTEARVRDKTEWVRRFVAERRMEGYPGPDADLAAENAEPPAPLCAAWLTGQIEQACALAGVAPPIDPKTIAVMLLRSRDADLMLEVWEFGPAEADPHRLLAHVEWLGLALPGRVAAAIARRLFNAVANRGCAVAEAPETETCALCGRPVQKGEPCGCCA